MTWARLSIRYPPELAEAMQRLRVEEYPTIGAGWHEWCRLAFWSFVTLTPEDRHEVITEIRNQLAEEKQP